METKEYIVTLKSGVNSDQFWHEIEHSTKKLTYIPSRPVDIARDRTCLERICEYWLTDQEAEILKNDPRVESVETPIRNISHVSIIGSTTQNIPGMNYNKQAGNIIINYATGNTSPPGPLFNPDYSPPFDASTNWGLIRHNSQNNPYPANPDGNSSSVSQFYNYALDGDGVDIIINDSGIQADHPEFSGRILNVDWNSIASAVGADTSFDWNAASYNDVNGHGTLVASIAAGSTYGWAKGANIIPLYYNMLAGQSSVEPLDMFEMIIYWHRNKGNNRPTIVNMSWDMKVVFDSPYNSGTEYYSLITAGSYQGTTWSGPQTDSFYQDKGLIALTNNSLRLQTNPQYPYSSTAYNTALGELIDAGIVVCQSAGNNGFKIDKPVSDGGTGDYDNYIIVPSLSSEPSYYHRGASPKDPRMIVVGALDTKTSKSGQDQRAEFSAAGPGIDIWAAGTYIMGAGCDANPQRYDGYAILNRSGTSFAAPQITGICSLYLQACCLDNIYDPDNCLTVKSWLLNNSTGNTFYSTGNATSYTDGLSLLGGPARVAYQAIEGLTQVKNTSGQWKPIKNLQIKNANNQWQPVKTVWVRDGNTWKPAYTKSS